MGQLITRELHPAELQMRRRWKLLDYQPQPDDEICQLDTEADQKGNTTVNHIYKETRLVYGQPARDLKLHAVDWSDYLPEMNNRPSPYDFPAFEHEARKDHHSKTEMSKTGHEPIQQTKPPVTKEIPKETTDAKEPTKETAKAKEADKNPIRLSHNQALDQCSLDDE
ncbi:hypothetical protein M3Y95_00415100 [Aphelenchoides besseyi]|nr:hypothetical protein M3Y95_00415100 [Aphelenchoides besseyi]